MSYYIVIEATLYYLTPSIIANCMNTPKSTALQRHESLNICLIWYVSLHCSLYKWGGTYLDLDVILKKNLSEIKPNYSGAESVNFVAAGILNFDHTGIGHDIAEFCLR